MTEYHEEDGLLSDIAKRIEVTPVGVRGALAIMERHERLATIHGFADERATGAAHEYAAYAWRRVATDAPVTSPHIFHVSRQIHRMALSASRRAIKLTLRAIAKRSTPREVIDDGSQLT